MGEQGSVLEQAITLATKLTLLEKVKLVEHVMAELGEELTPSARKPRQSLYGLWAGVQISEEDIDEARREMWGNFPREDI
jgi:hypothetical protein